MADRVDRLRAARRTFCRCAFSADFVFANGAPRSAAEYTNRLSEASNGLAAERCNGKLERRLRLGLANLDLAVELEQHLHGALELLPLEASHLVQQPIHHARVQPDRRRVDPATLLF